MGIGCGDIVFQAQGAGVWVAGFMRTRRQGGHAIYGGVVCARQGESQIAPPDRFRRLVGGTSRWNEQADSRRQGDARIFMVATGARTGASGMPTRCLGGAHGESAVRGLTGVFRQGDAKTYNATTATRQGESRFIWDVIRNRRQGRSRVFDANMPTLAIRAQAIIVYPVPVIPTPGLGISADPGTTVRAEVELITPLRVEVTILRGGPHVH